MYMIHCLIHQIHLRKLLSVSCLSEFMNTTIDVNSKPFAFSFAYILSPSPNCRPPIHDIFENNYDMISNIHEEYAKRCISPQVPSEGNIL